MVTNILIYLTVIMSVFTAFSGAFANQPISAMELIESTELKAHQAQLEKGEIVLITRGKLENDNELHVAMSLLVPAPLKKTVDKMQNLSSGSNIQGVLAVQEIKEAESAKGLRASFSAIAFTPSEIKEAEAMLKVGEYNFSKSDFDFVQKQLNGTDPKSKNHNNMNQDALLAAMTKAMQEILKSRYSAYHSQGLNGIEPYGLDEKKQIKPSEELVWATESMALLKSRFPAYYECLRNYPQQCAPNLINQFFWVKQFDGSRPMFGLKHWVLDVNDTYALITERQYYLSHTLNSMQVVIACLPYKEGTLVVLLNQAFTEKVNRTIGKKIAKAIGYGQVEKNIRPIFEALQAAFKK